MTIHASIELLDAIRGECPVFPFEPPNNTGTHARVGCTGDLASDRVVWGYARGQSEDNWGPVDCPKCLELWFRAMDPMRLDTLLLRGDLKPLEPEARAG